MVKTRWLGRIAGAAGVVTLAVGLGAVSAAASPLASAGMGTGTGTAATYAAQAEGAGLSGAQASALQARVDTYLALEPGARQVSANRVDFTGGVVTIGVPGQVRPADLGGRGGDLGARGDGARDVGVGVVRPEYGEFPCTYEDLCIFQYNNANLLGSPGEEVDYFRCGTYPLPGWTSTNGAYVNDQTPGTVARFLDVNHNVLESSTAHDSGAINWDPVWYVRPC